MPSAAKPAEHNNAGSLPEDLRDLPSLREIYVEGNEVSGAYADKPRCEWWCCYDESCLLSLCMWVRWTSSPFFIE